MVQVILDVLARAPASVSYHDGLVTDRGPGPSCSWDPRFTWLPPLRWPWPL